MPTLRDISDLIESAAPLSWQESWDNSGWQIAPLGLDIPCTGALLCLDVTPDAVAEAADAGLNLIVSHHPLIFRGLKQIVDGPDATPQVKAVTDAIRRGIAVYSSHTALDSAPAGPSRWLADRLGLRNLSILDPSVPADSDHGLGLVGDLPEPLPLTRFAALVQEVYGGPVSFTPGPDPDAQVSRVALCSGSGGEFIPAALKAGARAYITSDIRYHDLLDWGRRLILADTGHYESEICTKSIFSAIISEKFPNFALRMSRSERSPLLEHVQD